MKDFELSPGELQRFREETAARAEEESSLLRAHQEATACQERVGPDTPGAPDRVTPADTQYPYPSLQMRRKGKGSVTDWLFGHFVFGMMCLGAVVGGNVLIEALSGRNGNEVKSDEGGPSYDQLRRMEKAAEANKRLDEQFQQRRKEEEERERWRNKSPEEKKKLLDDWQRSGNK